MKQMKVIDAEGFRLAINGLIWDLENELKMSEELSEPEKAAIRLTHTIFDKFQALLWDHQYEINVIENHDRVSLAFQPDF